MNFGLIPNGKSVSFYVKDTGIGVDREKRKTIFSRFVQADIPNREAYQGVGLGLSIAKAYVEMLGGKIGLQSIAGKGSYFFFSLPKAV